MDCARHLSSAPSSGARAFCFAGSLVAMRPLSRGLGGFPQRSGAGSDGGRCRGLYPPEAPGVRLGRDRASCPAGEARFASGSGPHRIEQERKPHATPPRKCRTPIRRTLRTPLPAPLRLTGRPSPCLPLASSSAEAHRTAGQCEPQHAPGLQCTRVSQGVSPIEMTGRALPRGDYSQLVLLVCQQTPGRTRVTFSARDVATDELNRPGPGGHSAEPRTPQNVQVVAERSRLARLASDS
jgi:hypothetical protein